MLVWSETAIVPGMPWDVSFYKELNLQSKCVCDLLLHISRVYHSSPLLCYVVQSRQHPLMAIAYHFPLSFPASAARGGNTPLSIGDHCFGNCQPRFKWKGVNEWFDPHSLNNLSKWNERIHYSVQYVEPYALSYIKLHYAVLRSSIDRSIVSVYSVRSTLMCTHPVPVIEKRPSRMMIDTSQWIWD